MSKKLLVFPHSHYCEKARWALDYKAVPFQAVPILPGFHLITVRKVAQKTSVPVLLEGDKAVQGSNEIIDYLEENYPENPLNPVDADGRKKYLEIEQMVDRGIGKSLRQILYSGLLAYPDFICDCFTHSMPGFKRLVFKSIYPVLSKKIHQSYVISEEKVDQAKKNFDVTIDEIKKRLEGRKYLIGETFTRADLSVASMLSLLVMPKEHPFPWKEIPDAETKIFCDTYRDHPVSQWVREMYGSHRLHKK